MLPYHDGDRDFPWGMHSSLLVLSRLTAILFIVNNYLMETFKYCNVFCNKFAVIGFFYCNLAVHLKISWRSVTQRPLFERLRRGRFKPYILKKPVEHIVMLSLKSIANLVKYQIMKIQRNRTYCKSNTSISRCILQFREII